MRLLRLLAVLAMAMPILVGCETFKGVGKDITAIAEGTQAAITDQPAPPPRR